MIIDQCSMGRARKPWTREMMGLRMIVGKVGSRPEVAIVCPT